MSASVPMYDANETQARPDEESLLSTAASPNPLKGPFTVPVSRMPHLNEAIDKLNRRGERLAHKANLSDYAPIQATVIDHVVRRHRDELTGIVHVYYFDVVELTGIAPVVSDHTFLARIEHTAAGNIISAAPGIERDFTAWRDAKATTCDHCRTKRGRSDTFLLLSPEGKVLQIGRNCLADYLRTENVAGAINIFRFLHELSRIAADLEDREGGWGSRAPDGYEVESFLANAISVARKEGWVSRATAEQYGKQSTANTIAWLMSPASPHEHSDVRKRRLHLKAEPQDFEVATAAATWIRSKTETETSQYFANLKVALALPYVTYRNIGLVASAIGSYLREVETELAKKREKRPESTYFGEVKKRYDFNELEVVAVRYLDSDFGVRTLVIMVDKEGHRFVWFASGERPWNAGDKLTGRGTVKKHDEYKGTKQTTLSRCDLSKVEETSNA